VDYPVILTKAKRNSW